MVGVDFGTFLLLFIPEYVGRSEKANVLVQVTALAVESFAVCRKLLQLFLDLFLSGFPKHVRYRYTFY